MEWIPLLVVLAAIALYVRRLIRRFRRVRHGGAIEPSGDYSCDVVGESKYQDELEEIVGERTEDGAYHECIAEIVPEPRNKHDSNAMRVDIEGETVGYLSRSDAVTLRRKLRRKGVDGSVAANAVIVGGWKRGSGRKRGDTGSFGVRLDIDFDGLRIAE